MAQAVDPLKNKQQLIKALQRAASDVPVASATQTGELVEKTKQEAVEAAKKSEGKKII